MPAVFKGATITLIILVLCLSYPHAHKSNLHDFFPYHDSGVFAGAAVVSLLPAASLPCCDHLATVELCLASTRLQRCRSTPSEHHKALA